MKLVFLTAKFLLQNEGRSGEYDHQSALFGLTQCLFSTVATFIQA
jgi:hypothetical protein